MVESNAESGFHSEIQLAQRGEHLKILFSCSQCACAQGVLGAGRCCCAGHDEEAGIIVTPVCAAGVGGHRLCASPLPGWKLVVVVVEVPDTVRLFCLHDRSVEKNTKYEHLIKL